MNIVYFIIYIVALFILGIVAYAYLQGYFDKQYDDIKIGDWFLLHNSNVKVEIINVHSQYITYKVITYFNEDYVGSVAVKEFRKMFDVKINKLNYDRSLN